MSRTFYRASIVCGTAGFVILCFHYGFFNSWQEQLTDRLFIKSEQPRHIVIVAADEASLAALGQWPWAREEFAKAIRNLQSAKTIGIDIHFAEPSRAGASDDAALARAIQESNVPIVLPIEVAKGNIITKPLGVIEALSQTGFVNVSFSPDGILRATDTSLTLRSGETVHSFSAALFGEIVEGTPERLRIAYSGPAETILTVSMRDVVDGTIPPAVFKDSYVLIGATAESLRDNFKTPFGLMPGVEVHANALNTLVEKRFMYDLPPFLVWPLLLVVATFAGLAVTYFRNFLALTAILAVFVVTLSVKALVLFSFGIVIPLLYVLIALFLGSAAMLAFEYVSESKEKQFIKKSFQQYLSPAVVVELMKDPKKLSLGGERKRVTVLFSDIRGFTTISEGLTPENLTHLMNEYLTAMTDIIMEHGGLVDKYIGDAIMAFWGAPIEDSLQEKRAASAVQDMTKKLKELNVEWKKRGIPEIKIGVGLNTGEVIVGNMGSTKRFNYTIMGDEVNFASRVESLTKKYGVTCLISESTYEKIKADKQFTTREIDTVRVKGKREPKKIYELITAPVAKESVAEFELGRKAYAAGKWDEAISHFKKVLSYGPDATSEMFIERCEDLKKDPPTAWDGVYDHESK